VSDEPYGDGLVFVAKDDLQCEVWLDKEWLGDIGLGKLDNFVKLRKYLYEVDDVAVLTEYEASEVRDLIREAANA
jgi:hypothetical protein